MKKIQIILLTIICCLVTIPHFPIYANEYEESEGEWLKKCSVAQDSKEAAEECKRFKEYYNKKTNELNNQIADMKKTSKQLKSDLSNISELIMQLDNQIKVLNQQMDDEIGRAHV